MMLINTYYWHRKVLHDLCSINRNKIEPLQMAWLAYNDFITEYIWTLDCYIYHINRSLNHYLEWHQGIQNIGHLRQPQCSSPNIRTCPSSAVGRWVWWQRWTTVLGVVVSRATARCCRPTAPWCSEHLAGWRSRLTRKTFFVPCRSRLHPLTPREEHSRNSLRLSIYLLNKKTLETVLIK